jgi:hypothetical protein
MRWTPSDRSSCTESVQPSAGEDRRINGQRRNRERGATLEAGAEEF